MEKWEQERRLNGMPPQRRSKQLPWSFFMQQHNAPLPLGNVHFMPKVWTWILVSFVTWSLDISEQQMLASSSFWWEFPTKRSGRKFRAEKDAWDWFWSTESRQATKNVGASVEQDGGQLKAESSGNLCKTEKLLPMCLLLFRNNGDLKNKHRNYRKLSLGARTAAINLFQFDL